MALGENLTKKSSDQKSEKVEGKPTETEHLKTTALEDVDSEDEGFVTLEQFCVFRAGKEEYALPIHMVKEVVKLPPMAYVPQMPDYLTGMVNVRGSIYGILDLTTFFKGTDNQVNEEYKYLLVIDHEEYKMGILITDVPDTVSIPVDSIEKLTSSTIKSVKGRKYLQGIIKKDKRMIILFDILEMISSPKFTEVMV
ncbi:chemotaxis protein CheW [Ekhidna sp.]|uniref:chemotaxis protein CheW n=1 Tax=Ekhidna sp. TaxID=2608089 RepID=UPI00351427CF